MSSNVCVPENVAEITSSKVDDFLDIDVRASLIKIAHPNVMECVFVRRMFLWCVSEPRPARRHTNWVVKPTCRGFCGETANKTRAQANHGNTTAGVIFISTNVRSPGISMGTGCITTCRASIPYYVVKRKRERERERERKQENNNKVFLETLFSLLEGCEV